MTALSPIQSEESGINNVRFETEYRTSDSVDNYGNLYIKAWSHHSYILTFVNSDGSVTVCTSGQGEKINIDMDDSGEISLTRENIMMTFIYEYSQNLEEKRN